MEITKPNQIPELLREHFADHQLNVIFTQWEGDDPEEDEMTTQFVGTLIETAVNENKFSGLDGSFHFQTENEDEVVEILMDFPDDDEDVVATLEGDTLHILGNESELLLSKI